VDDLYAAGAEIVIGAHYQNYERFAPQTPDGAADASFGIREFVVGTGGAGHSSFGTPAPGSEVRNSSTYGVLKLTLSTDGTGAYTWDSCPWRAGASLTRARELPRRAAAPTSAAPATPTPAATASGWHSPRRSRGHREL